MKNKSLMLLLAIILLAFPVLADDVDQDNGPAPCGTPGPFTVVEVVISTVTGLPIPVTPPAPRCEYVPDGDEDNG